MLLSMLISFLLARKFRWKIYVALIAVIVTLISLFSVTVIILHPLNTTLSWVQGNNYPLPLSFPFYVCIFNIGGYCGGCYHVSIYFLTLRIDYQSWLSPYMSLDFFAKVYIPFLLINIVGAILGYWINKTAFIDKLLKKRQNVSP